MKGYDCTNVLDLTKAEIEGRKETMNALKALKDEVPGFEKAKLRITNSFLQGAMTCHLKNCEHDCKRF